MSDLGRPRPDTHDAVANSPTYGAQPRLKATGPIKGEVVLLILAIILLIIAIAGGVIVHPLLFALAIVALVLFFAGRA
jgi:hypothetical protein